MSCSTQVASDRPFSRSLDVKTIASHSPRPLRLAGLALGLGLAALAAVEARAGDATGAPREAPSTPAAAPSPLTTLPRPLDPRPLLVGRLVADVSATDLDGKPRALSTLLGKSATVLCMTSTTCPISAKLAPALARLEAEHAAKGVAFVFVNVDDADTVEACRAHAKAHGLAGTYLLDRTGAVKGALQATSTTEVFVLDAARTLVFRGAVNDQYAVGITREAPTREYLREALASALASARPAVEATSAPGCRIEPAPLPKEAAAAAPTYHGRISRIVSQSCVECHRAGGVAPFPLETYAQVAAKSASIADAVRERIMPPWPASRPEAGAPSPWANDRSLVDEDRQALLDWVAGGKPLGDAKDAAIARTYPTGWTIGTPDAVFEIPAPVPVKAEGLMRYVHVRVPVGFAEDRWVRAVQVSPTAREVVHHVLAFAVPAARPGERPERPRLDETTGFFGAYVPGMEPVSYPPGYAKKLPAGSDLFFQLHYTPNGTETVDRTQIGIVFAKEAPEHEVEMTGIANRGLVIPPGASDHLVRGTTRMPDDVRVLALMPHMHVRGRSFRFDAARPDGSQGPLLIVPRWDFDWQMRYVLREPVTLSKEAIVAVAGRYDNSTGNPENPDPTKKVKWGPQTTDEMLLGYIEFVRVKKPAQAAPASDGTSSSGGEAR